MRNFTITGSGDANAVLIENAGNIVIDGLTLNKGTGNFASGLTYRISEDTPFTHLRIRNVAITQSNGIVLENTSKSGTLSGYTITGNIAEITDGIKGSNAVISGNITPNTN